MKSKTTKSATGPPKGSRAKAIITNVNQSVNEILEQIYVDLGGNVGCAFPMVIRFDFRIGQYKDNDHQEDAPHFTIVNDHFQRFFRNGYSVTSCEKSEEHIQFAFDLTKANMQELYEAAPEWGWHDDEKMKELKNEKQHILLIKDQDDLKCGFVSLRWLIENGEAVLYLYEIQLISLACRMGLGTKLMKLVEKMASKTRMSKVVLTVLVGNTAAIEFYRKLGYTNNEKMPGKCSYRILSKNVKTNPEIELKYTA